MTCQGTRVHEARVRAGLRQDQLCELVGLSRPTLANIEGGRFRAGPGTATRIEQALGLPEGCLRAAPARRIHRKKGRPKEGIPRRLRLLLQNLRLEVSDADAR